MVILPKVIFPSKPFQDPNSVPSLNNSLISGFEYTSISTLLFNKYWNNSIFLLFQNLVVRELGSSIVLTTSSLVPSLYLLYKSINVLFTVIPFLVLTICNSSFNFTPVSLLALSKTSLTVKLCSLAAFSNSL